MNQYLDILANRKHFQLALIEAGKTATPPYNCGPDGADGNLGNDTAKAVVRFRASHGLSAVAVTDAKMLQLLNLNNEGPMSNPNGIGIPAIGATLEDYLINAITSKINWFALLMTGVIVTFVNTRFGLNLDAATQNTITTVLTSVLLAGVGILRTFFNSPHVASVPPAVVKKAA